MERNSGTGRGIVMCIRCEGLRIGTVEKKIGVRDDIAGLSL